MNPAKSLKSDYIMHMQCLYYWDACGIYLRSLLWLLHSHALLNIQYIGSSQRRLPYNQNNWWSFYFGGVLANCVTITLMYAIQTVSMGFFPQSTQNCQFKIPSIAFQSKSPNVQLANNSGYMVQQSDSRLLLRSVQQNVCYFNVKSVIHKMYGMSE